MIKMDIKEKDSLYEFLQDQKEQRELHNCKMIAEDEVDYSNVPKKFDEPIHHNLITDLENKSK